MNDKEFLEIKLVQLKELLQASEGDAFLKAQLECQIEDVEEELRSAQGVSQGTLFGTSDARSRFAFFLNGQNFDTSAGIRPSLAGEILIQGERMFNEQALHEERELAKEVGRVRRPRGAAVPEILFSGTPRGSFGLEFSPKRVDNDAGYSVHSKAFSSIAGAIIKITKDGASLEEKIEGISSKLLKSMKIFLKVLAQNGSDLRIAGTDLGPITIPSTWIASASTSLESDWEVVDLKINGIFKGLTKESLRFDLYQEGGGVISGQVDENLGEEDLTRIYGLGIGNKKCVATIERETIRSVGVGQRFKYLLLDAVLAE